MKHIYAGVDIGSTTSKCVLIDEDRNILDFSILDTNYDRNASGEAVLRSSLDRLGIGENELSAVYSTGYGRDAFLRRDKSIPEIICHGKGTVFLRPGVRTIIDIGGQDSKVIEIDEDGMISKFEMNEKCAAGTGRFFEVLSGRLLNVPIEELGPLALRSTKPCMISSACTVFAESEIISYLTQGAAIEDIAMGILDSTARRIKVLAGQSQIPMREEIVLSGGIGHNEALKPAFENRFGKKMTILDEPQMPASLGAALMAAEDADRR